MDNIGYEILKLLSSDSRMTYNEISKEVNLSIPAVKERINKLEDKGIIKKSTIEVDIKKLGREVSAIICVDVKSSMYEEFVDFCSNNAYVTALQRVVGSYNAIIAVSIESIDNLEKFIDRIKNYGTCLTSVITTTYFKNRIFL